MKKSRKKYHLGLDIGSISVRLAAAIPAGNKELESSLAGTGLFFAIAEFISSLRYGAGIEAIAQRLGVDTSVLRRQGKNIVGWLAILFIGCWLIGIQYALPLFSFFYLIFSINTCIITENIGEGD